MPNPCSWVEFIAIFLKKIYKNVFSFSRLDWWMISWKFMSFISRLCFCGVFWQFVALKLCFFEQWTSLLVIQLLVIQLGMVEYFIDENSFILVLVIYQKLFFNGRFKVPWALSKWFVRLFWVFGHFVRYLCFATLVILFPADSKRLTMRFAKVNGTNFPARHEKYFRSSCIRLNNQLLSVDSEICNSHMILLNE